MNREQCLREAIERAISDWANQYNEATLGKLGDDDAKGFGLRAELSSLIMLAIGAQGPKKSD